MFSKGFYIASDNGYMALWVRSEENNSTSGKQAFDFIRRWQPSATKSLRILSLDVSAPSEDYLCVSLENNNIGIVQTKSIGLNEDLSKEIKFHLVCKGFHSGQISSIDIALQRPLILTASKEDSTIRLWNYKTFTCEMAREYYVLEDMNIREAAKPLISVAIHPSGYYMAASFIDKIRIHHILHDEFKHYKNIDIRYCKMMRFSNGGHIFACIESGDSDKDKKVVMEEEEQKDDKEDGENKDKRVKNVIQGKKDMIHLYNAYTLERLHSIELAVSAKQISSLLFNDKDISIAVTGQNGYLSRWNLPQYTPVNQNKFKPNENVSYSSLDFIQELENQQDLNVAVVAGAQKTADGQAQRNVQIITSKDNLNKNFFAEVGEYTQVKFVRLNQKVSGLLTGSD